MKKRYLICTDLDRTLIPNGDAPEDPNAMSHFKRFLDEEDATLAFVTGRDRSLVMDAIERYQLPLPQIIIADVGASIYLESGQGVERLASWDELLSRRWGPSTPDTIRSTLSSFAELEPQAPEKQSHFKISYTNALSDTRGDLSDAVSSELNKNGISANVIWSVDKPSRVGLLDVLPPAANKLKAIRFIMDRLGYTLDNTVFSGDSGNDLDVILSPVNSILVANAEPDIKEKSRQGVIRFANSIYIARGTKTMNGNYVAGIMEGINHFFPETLYTTQ